MDSDANCLICNELLHSENQTDKQSITVKTRAIETIKNASIRRKDKMHLKLQKVTLLTLHKSCYTVYIREISINTANARRSRLISQVRRENKIKRMNERGHFLSPFLPPINNENAVVEPPAPKPAKKPVVKPEPRDFDFKLDCLFCGNDASEKFIEKMKQRGQYNIYKVSLVMKTKTKEKILAVTKASEESDVYMKKIERRIENVDLVQVMRRYHKKCIIAFHKPRPKTSLIGRPVSQETINAINFILNYIVNTPNESEFSLKLLLQKYDDEEKPALRTVQGRFEKFVGDELVMSAVRKGDCNLSVVGSRDRLLNNWHDHLQMMRDKQANVILL